MAHGTFRAYIDESGDEGFVFNAHGSGSSRWFVLSAVVVRHVNEHHLIRAVADTRTTLGKKSKAPLHFRNLKHEHRKPYIRLLANVPVLLASVLAYKPAITDQATFQGEPNLLYRYCTRYLLERVSWLCRDNRKTTDTGTGVDLIFSNRRRMSYDAIREYLVTLKLQPGVKIVWGEIDPARISAVNHDQLAGLQAADAVATSLYYAVCLDRFGEVEQSHAKVLEKRFYRHNDKIQGYGLKFFPDFDLIKAQNPHLAGLV